VPILEYQCDECGEVFERFFTTITEGTKHPDMPCPKDGCGIGKKIISQTLTPIFYGEGWSCGNISKRHSYKAISKNHGNETMGSRAPANLP
jgi:predicted nucleic acid-binding Zn ribbon protein